mgnify:CR=1 FL=1
MTEEEYLELLDDDPDKALKWMYESRFIFFTMGDGIEYFDDDLMQEFIKKLLDFFSLNELQAAKMLEHGEDENPKAISAFEELSITGEFFDEEEDGSISMDWEEAEPWSVVEWLSTLGFDIQFYGYSGGAMGEAGTWFIR